MFIIITIICLLVCFVLGYKVGKKEGRLLGISETRALIPLIIREESLKEGYCLVCKNEKTGKTVSVELEK